MNKRRILYTLFLCAFVGLLWVGYSHTQGVAEEKCQYVGTDKCNTCHADMAKKWALTPHRATLFNKDTSKQGCESCHGPGSKHVESGGDTQWILSFKKLNNRQITDICMKCHTQEDVTLWQTSLHARGKVSCINCHDPHSEGAPMLLKDIENGKLNLQTLTRAIQQAQLCVNDAQPCTKEREEAQAKVDQLTAERDKLKETLKGTETAYKRIAEPYLCYNCHKTQEVQGRMISHHPIIENKMTCTSCHNPHGGPRGMLRGESVTETCFRCHADKVGPFTFDHPPVSEDCTICHNPHGSVVNNLLLQNEPFVCLKCHAGPHSRGGATSPLASPTRFPVFYARCTSCHNQPHGSNEHAAFHF